MEPYPLEDAMKPFFKYPGGKGRELKHIIPMLPASFNRVVEPFVGGGALAFHLEKPSFVSDINDNVTNIFEVVKDRALFDKLMTMIQATNLTQGGEDNVKHLEKLYYQYRDREFGNKDPVIKAYRFLLLRQLGFSGMYRVNPKTGKSNVPFGWYPKLGTKLDLTYHQLLQNWEIKLQSFEITLASTTIDDFVFLDPPYYERNSTYGTNSDAGTNEKLHQDLYTSLTTMQAPWLLIHSDCELYRDLYQGFNTREIDFFYSQNFKGRSNAKSAVKHLYITNYKSPQQNLLQF